MFTVDIVLKLSFGISWPKYQFNLHNETVTPSKDISYQRLVRHSGQAQNNLALTWPQKLACETVLENDQIVRDQSIEIITITIDGIFVPQQMLTKISWYEPHYRQDFLDYCASHSIEITDKPQSIVKFWHAGIWHLPLVEDFWFKYNAVRQNNTHSDHTGNNSDQIKSNLSRLKKLL
jgi:hypothetical protein